MSMDRDLTLRQREVLERLTGALNSTKEDSFEYSLIRVMHRCLSNMMMIGLQVENATQELELARVMLRGIGNREKAIANVDNVLVSTISFLTMCGEACDLPIFEAMDKALNQASHRLEECEP